MRELTHEAAAEMLAEAALDTLAADDQAAVLAHAATCPDCGPTLAALRDATSELAFSLTSSTDDPVRRARVRTRLLARARADLSVAELTPGAGDAAAPASDAAPPARGPLVPGPSRRMLLALEPRQE